MARQQACRSWENWVESQKRNLVVINELQFAQGANGVTRSECTSWGFLLIGCVTLVHFLRNALAHAGKREHQMVLALIQRRK